MSRILESIKLNVPAQQIWDYVQEYRHRSEWDVTTLHFKPIDSDRVDKNTRVFVRTSGLFPMEYEGIYISFEPYTVSAVKMTHPIRNVPFHHMAGSWRYKSTEDGGTEFSMTFDYQLKGGILGQLADKFFIESAIRRGMRSALEKLQKKFNP